MPRFAPAHCGIDISDLVLRVAVVQLGRQGPTLRAWQEVLLPEGLIVDGEIQHPREVADRLTVLLRRAQPSAIRSRRVIACLPDRRTFVKLVPLPSTNTSQPLDQLVSTQLAQNIPFPPEEVYFDWQSAPPVKGRTDAVVIGAAPRTLVDSYIDVIARAGLTAIALEMESIAIARAIVPDPSPNRARLIVDLGGTRTTVIGLGNQTILFSSSLAFSGSHLTRAVAQSLHLSFTDAERLKALYGLSRDKGKGAVGRAIQHVLPDLTNHLRDLIAFSENHFPEAGPVQHVQLCGGGALLHRLPEHISDVLRLPVSIGLPQLAVSPQFPPARLPSFATAIGLAMHPL